MIPTAKELQINFGLSKESDPEKIEQDLLKIFDKSDYKDINHLFIWHGRNTCISRSPKCEECVLNKICEEFRKNNNNKIVR